MNINIIMAKWLLTVRILGLDPFGSSFEKLKFTFNLDVHFILC